MEEINRRRSKCSEFLLTISKSHRKDNKLQQPEPGYLTLHLRVRVAKTLRMLIQCHTPLTSAPMYSNEMQCKETQQRKEDNLCSTIQSQMFIVVLIYRPHNTCSLYKCNSLLLVAPVQRAKRTRLVLIRLFWTFLK